MVEFDVEFVGHNPDEMQERFNQINLEARNRTNHALRETAEEVKADLEDTSPVDTGEYKKSWYILNVDYDEVWILNEKDYAKYVMMPNSQMVGSSSADLSSQGILHNAKGVARSHSDSLSLNLAEKLENMMKSFEVNI